MKRNLPLVVISDVHLGTYSCNATPLLNYLKSIQPQILILNGDIIDTWSFNKQYFPEDHLEVIHQILNMSLSGTTVYYITGNHDDVLRKFSDFNAGNIHLRDKLVLILGDQKYWIFHGDIFDISIINTPWLAKMGGRGYDLLIRINRAINKVRSLFGKSEWSFAHYIKKRVKKAVKFIDDFEAKAIEVAAEKEFDAVICGHIHQPAIKNILIHDRKITYLNAGDWVENLTALEYNFHKWTLYHYDPLDFIWMNEPLPVNNKNAVRQAKTEWIEKITQLNEV